MAYGNQQVAVATFERRNPDVIARELLELAHAAEYARSRAAPWTPAIRSPIDPDKLAAAWMELEARIDELPARYAALARAVDRAAGLGVVGIAADGRISCPGYRRMLDEFVSRGESRLLKGRENELRLILAAPAIARQPSAVQALVDEARAAAREYFMPAAAEAITQAQWLAQRPVPKSVNGLLARRPYRFVGIGVDVTRLNAVTYYAGMWSAAVGVWWFNHLHDVANELASTQHLPIAPVLLIPPLQLALTAVAAGLVPLVLVVRRVVVGRRRVATALEAARAVVEKLRPMVGTP